MAATPFAIKMLPSLSQSIIADVHQTFNFLRFAIDRRLPSVIGAVVAEEEVNWHRHTSIQINI